ncbi:uncharacterized protein LOC143266008 [Megachile rotundata]|uniref:uncharacterized protein LOC143266008 n=1 Tax=Megachile rotundata TaxID=143995 RepID=UPI003FCF664B
MRSPKVFQVSSDHWFISVEGTGKQYAKRIRGSSVQQIMQTRLLADPVNEDLQLRGRGKESGEGMPLYANQKATLKADRIRGREFRDRFADMNAPRCRTAAAITAAGTDDG